MLIKIAKKANIQPGEVKSFKFEDWEITVFNVDGRYCFCVNEDKAAHARHPSSKETLKEDALFMPTVMLNRRCELVIEGDDICILIDAL